MRDFYKPLCEHDHDKGSGLITQGFLEDTFKTLLNALGTMLFLNPDQKPADLLQSEEGKKLINATTQVLLEGITKEFGKSNPDLVESIKENIFVFSGFKTYQLLKDMSLSLLDDKGKLVSFDKFKEAVKAINITYNANWLESEYITANLSARQAAKWEKYARQADKYDLEYDAVEDSHTSDLCKRLNGVVKPVNDSFWDSYYPPNHWRCRSIVRQVSKGTKGNDIPADTPKPQNMFNNNVGKKGIIFPDNHPYFEGLSAEEKANVMGSVEKARAIYEE